jgi:alkanesulfonate monooxygenase SsuD/methylene tetrahydromethanopterin reductase-like flavin-dependent oxidoreductase (luciferase family)
LAAYEIYRKINRMTPVQFGFTLPTLPQDATQRSTFVADIHRALTLISGHFDAARMIDHLWHDDLESFTTLAHLAALHPKLKFGHSVICQSFRNPALVAKMGATLQFLSGGRFLFGIGTGWFEEEYKAYGYDFPPARVRVEQLAEVIQIIKSLWTEEKTSFSGAHYRVFEAACDPKPVPPPPIMVGAFKPRMLRITARYADEWNVSSTGIQKYRRLAVDFERACGEVSRDPAVIRRSWGGGCVCMPTQAEAERIAGELFRADNLEEDFGFVGTPRQVVEQMRPFIDLGVGSFMLDCGGFPRLTTLELLINEVLPVLNH